MTSPPKLAALMAVLFVVVSCSESPESVDDDTPPTCLESVYPDEGVIDPDDPQFEDSTRTREQVQSMFAHAKETNSDVYWAYKAASDSPELIQCAYCACGCAITEDHLSAIDCFKDLHGFT